MNSPQAVYPRWEVFDPANNEVYVGEEQGNAIFAINATNGFGSGIVNVGPGPHGYFSNPVPLAVDPAGHRLFVGACTLNTTCDVITIDDRTNLPIGRTTPVGWAPETAMFDPVTDRLYVVNAAGGNVTVLNASGGLRPIANITVGGVNADAVALDPRDHRLFVANYDLAALTIINTTSLTAQRVKISFERSPSVYGQPVALAYDPRNGCLYVANDYSGNVSVLNATSGAFIGPGIPLGGPNTDGLLYDPVTNNIFAIDGGWVYRINPQNNTVVGAVVRAGITPDGLALDSRTGEIFVVNGDSVNMSAFNTTTGAVVFPNIALRVNFLQDAYDPLNHLVYAAAPDPGLACVSPGRLYAVRPGLTPTILNEVPVGLGPESATVDLATGDIYVPNLCSGNLTVVNGTTNRAVANIPLAAGAGPVAATFDPRSGDIWVACAFGNNLTVISGSNYTIVRSGIPVGANPDGVAYDSRDNLIYVVNYGSGTVTSINATTYAVVNGSIAVGASPEAIVYNPLNNELYTANAGSGSVTILNGSTGKVIDPGLRVGDGPVALTLDPVHDLVYVANSQAGTLRIIDATSDSTLWNPIPVSGDPQGVTYATATNQIIVSGFASGSIGIVVSGPQIVSFSARPSTLEAGTATQLSVRAVNGAPPYTFAYGGLPPGCVTQNASTLACSPAANGTYQLTATVTDTNGTVASAQTTLVVTPGPTIDSIVIGPSPTEAGIRTHFSLRTSGGTLPYIVAYSGLPTGCPRTPGPAFDCWPAVPGTYLIQARITDSLGVGANQAAILTVEPSLAIQGLLVSPSAVSANGTVTFLPLLQGGVPPFAFSYSGLPTPCGATNQSASGLVICQPSQVGNYTPRLTVEDALHVFANASTRLVVVGAPSVTPSVLLFVATPPGVSLGNQTAMVLVLSPGTVWSSISYRGLPPGCQSAPTELLRCVPSKVGSYNISVTVVVPGYGPGLWAATSLSVFNATLPGDRTEEPTPASGAWVQALGAGLLGGLAVGGIVAASRYRRGRNSGGREPPP